MAKPSEYERSSAALAAGAVGTAEREALAAEAEACGVESDLVAEAAAIVRTDSTPVGGGFLRRRRKPVATTLLLTGPYLAVVAVEAGSRPIARIYRLATVEIAEYRPTLIEDVGIELTGSPLGGTEPATRFLPLDEGADGMAFRRSLDDAIAAGRR